MKSREQELKEILNTAEFGSEEWEAASKELHAIRVADIEENPAEPFAPKHGVYTTTRGWV